MELAMMVTAMVVGVTVLTAAAGYLIDRAVRRAESDKTGDSD